MRIPIDQFGSRAGDLERLTDAFNAATGQSLSTGAILHYMLRRRKDGVWVTFNGAHRRAEPLSDGLFSSDEWIIVDAIYVQFGVGADTFLYDTRMASDFSARVALAIGRVIRGDVLAAAVIQRRKDDLLPKLRREGFEDIGQIG